ncbi:hypothetical protein LINPERPRIM_LOCUS3730, partial [Linum perenne]
RRCAGLSSTGNGFLSRFLVPGAEQDSLLLVTDSYPGVCSYLFFA